EQDSGFVEQPTDQRRLAVIDRAADDEAQQALALLPGQKVVEVEHRRFWTRGHQKYPSCFLRSIEAWPSWSMMRSQRSEQRHSMISRMTSGTDAARLSIAPVSG